ncbi:MAG TPA: hypothetical protein VE263_18960 [Candidatus Angelobacter sp.]|nr:hypothetical protein [Candidatus Angelobacter sp.]
MTPQEEKELLLRVVTKLAGKQVEQGGFIPFGATLGSSRNVQLLMPKGMKRDVTRDELDAYWIRELRKATASGECKTACWIADVRMQSEEGVLHPAVMVHVEQAGAFSEDILYPYKNERGSGVTFGEPTSENTEHQIFATL